MVTERKVRVVGVVICFRLVPHICHLDLTLSLSPSSFQLHHPYVLTSGENHFLVLVSCEL